MTRTIILKKFKVEPRVFALMATLGVCND